MLIILRGNSGSGKSTTAKLLREAAIERGVKRKIAIIEQDYLRRYILKEKESEGSDNVGLMEQTALFAMQRNYVVILEGIFYSARYKAMLERLIANDKENYIYYFDVSIEETLARLASKPNAHEFGEKEMREWYKGKDLLGIDNEQILGESLSQQQIIDRILEDIRI